MFVVRVSATLFLAFCIYCWIPATACDSVFSQSSLTDFSFSNLMLFQTTLWKLTLFFSHLWISLSKYLEVELQGQRKDTFVMFIFIAILPSIKLKEFIMLMPALISVLLSHFLIFACLRVKNGFCVVLICFPLVMRQNFSYIKITCILNCTLEIIK